MKKRVHVFYVGRVQGVGFRLTAEETAYRVGVTGWVRNLRDGRVELIAEGEAEVLEQFLEAIRTGPMCKFIEGIEIAWSEPTEQFEDFEIRY